jgi:peptidoglycan hydrolase-like protein with peptidoglycan-binding domain
MADEMVLNAQQFINMYYGDIPGIPVVTEDGIPGWATMYALVRCLQHELGITSLSDNFGPTTLSLLTAQYPSIDQSTSPNGPLMVIRIMQAAMYCKGYDGGEWQSNALPSGAFSDRVIAGVQKLKADSGVSGVYPGAAMVPKLFKALLTMDAYVVVSGGSSTVRSIQQWMNASYLQHTNFFVIPCDGVFSRDVQKALMLAIQFQIGISDASANGVFGPATQAGLKANLLSVGSSGRWVQLFSAAMVFNQRSGATFTDTFTSGLSDLVSTFQSFVKLPVTGKGDFQTWASLLVSTGDPTRRGQALDCVTEITATRAKTLTAAGYQVVGRYLSNVANTSLNKMIQFGELATIADNGLRCFPIYQTYGEDADYFRSDQGFSDALSAIDHARFYGFKTGTRIYFAVDFDALDEEVTNHIIPHFRGINEAMDERGNPYRIGIYGPRNICSRVGYGGLTTASFVSDMSTGYSGNLGYPMPADWAFDQIATISLGSGDGRIEIDNNILSGRDTGQNTFDPGEYTEHLDVNFDSSLKPALLADLQQYLQSQGIPERGGNPIEDAAQVYSTTEAFNVMMSFDPLITGLARALKMRKALIAVPIFWEVRKYAADDPFGDEGVMLYYAGNRDPLNKWIKRDSSTGLGQIFSVVAIVARNYAIGQGIISGAIKNPDLDADVWEIWQKLHNDNAYNISTAAYVLIQAATDIRRNEGDTPITIPQPSLDYSDEYSRLVLRRYQGFGDDPESDSYIKLGVYRVLEKYFGPLRN